MINKTQSSTQDNCITENTSIPVHRNVHNLFTAFLSCRGKWHWA